MPTLRLDPDDAEYAIAGAVPVDAAGITYVYGRQSCDTRSLEGGEIDMGNGRYSGQEALVIFDDVFIPNELIFMNGETEFAAMLVERFTGYHRRTTCARAGWAMCSSGLRRPLPNQRKSRAERNSKGRPCAVPGLGRGECTVKR